MKKFVSLFALAFTAFTLTGFAQQEQPFAGPLADKRPKSATPTPAAANTSPGKKTVGDVVFSTDEKGKSATTSFPSGTTMVYLTAKGVAGAKGDKVRVEWFADDAGKNLKKGQRFLTSPVELPDAMAHDPVFHGSGPIDGKFPVGKYHVDVSVGSEKLKTARFTVQ